MTQFYKPDLGHAHLVDDGCPQEVLPPKCPPTLANLITNDNGLRVFCDSCDRCVDLDVDNLVSIHGRDMPLPEIGRRSRCTACGGMGASVQVVAVRWKSTQPPN